MTRPCLIAGHDLWREILNDNDPDAAEALLLKLGCEVVTVPNEPGDDSEPLQEPSQLKGWWLVSWPDGSNADKFDETAELEQFTAQQLPTSGETDLANQLSAELYQPLKVIDTKGSYTLMKGFRHWRVATHSDGSISFWPFPTEQAARAYLATK